MIPFLIFMSALFANGVRALSGFGGALILVPLLTMIWDLQTAAPSMAMINLIPGLVIVFYHRLGIKWSALWRVLLGMLIGVPIGIYLLRSLDRNLMLISLGIFIIGYTLFTMLGPELPTVKRPVFGYVAGVFVGLLGGAYNAPGPPAIVYGTMSRWQPAEFKSTLSSIFVLTGTTTLIFHYFNGFITPTVLYTVGWGLPGGLLGSYVGLKLSDYLDPDAFRRIVYVLLLLIGLNLVRQAVL